MNKPPSPPVSVAPSDLRAGALLTEALVQVAAEHARDREVPESVVVAALSSALGCVAAAIARGAVLRCERLVGLPYSEERDRRGNERSCQRREQEVE